MTSFWFESALLPSGWAGRVRMTCDGDRIARVETGVDPVATDERHGIALPGMPNLHSHAFQRGMAGLAERRGPGADSFWTWRDVMYRFANGIGPEQMEAIAAMAFVEMLEAGFTHVGEFHYVHHDRDGRPFDNPAEMGDRIAAAAEATGIGLTLLPVFYMTSGFGATPPRQDQRRFIHDPDSYARLIEASRRAVSGLTGGKVGVAPHSLRAVPEDSLRAVLGIAQGGMPVHIHIAEQVAEVEDCLGALGARPVEWLLGQMQVDARWCLVHATHITQAEIDAIARSGAVVGLCPITEANLGDGIFPATAFIEAGGKFGVGSDSNVRIDMAEELRTLEYSQRLAHRARNLISSAAMPSTGRTMFDHALAGGAQALGCTGKGLAADEPADFLTLRADDPTLSGKTGDTLLDAFIFSNRASMIAGVWRAGRQCVKDGIHVARSGVEKRFVDAVASVAA